MKVRDHPKYTGADISLVIKKLLDMDPIPMLELNLNASLACR